MAQSLSHILLHLIFSTKDREPMIPSELEDELYRLSPRLSVIPEHDQPARRSGS
jgi:hypothetical protein